MSIDALLDDFEFIDDWEERYKYVIELGRKLPPLPEEVYRDENKVQGCASQVWLISELDDSQSPPRLYFRGDSDAHIVKGLLSILLELYSGQTPTYILETDAHAIFKRIGLEEHLTSQRANGLASMIKTMKAHAAGVAEAA